MSKKIILFLFDLACFAAIAVACHPGLSRLSQSISYPSDQYVRGCVLLLLCTFLCRALFKVYGFVWRNTDSAVYLKMILADALGVLLAVGIARVGGDWFVFDLRMHLLVATLHSIAALSSRPIYRLIHLHRKRRSAGVAKHIPVAIVGAGHLGVFLAEELAKTQYLPMFFIERDPYKIGTHVADLPVYPDNDATLRRIAELEIAELFVAVSDLNSETASALYERYCTTGCRIRIYEQPLREAEVTSGLSKSAASKGSLHDFRIEDLLFREALQFENTAKLGFYVGKTVLVTGGGGSIGSEICRQIAGCAPQRLIVLDIYENNAYEIQQELLRRYGRDFPLSVEIASVRDRERMDAVFAYYQPQIVFHAAAHKHVPLMEQNACEAIKNNVLGTYNVADMAEKHGAEKFILISTDKAVNPTNVMGASKRLCEMIVQCRGESDTQFAAVRFGNVLGSNGSVIPLFRKQIEEGGPVTITDKRVIRYFMTISEAAQLVMRAGAMAKKGELFVLDMGKPVRIYDLAANMIRLYGLVPERDIEIREIGLRPGEKLYEELLIKNEALSTTENSMIFVETDTPLTREEVDRKIQTLTDAIASSVGQESAAVREAMRAVVPTYRSPEEVNSDAESAVEMRWAGECARE